jgi:SH3-like domain-containing protein
MFALLVFGTRLIPTSLRAISRKVAAGFGAIVVLSASAVAARWPELHRAVITAANPATHMAPADSSAVSFALKPGDVVRTGKTYGQFVRVLSSDGRAGWIRETSLEGVIPSGAKAPGTTAVN